MPPPPTSLPPLRRAARLAAALAIVASFAVAVAFVARFAVDLPQWDEWFFTPFLVRVANGEATLRDWLAPHNEHVVLVPRVLLCLLAFTLGWDVRYGMAAGLLFAALTFFVLRRIAREAEPEGTPFAPVADVACALLLFSLAQWENWLWGMQSAWFLVNLLLAVALLAASTLASWARRFGAPVALVACTLASLTTAQGPFSWLAVLPLLFRTPGGRPPVVRARFWLLAAACSWAVVVAHLPEGRSGLQAANVFGAPAQTAAFFLILVASPFAPGEGAAVLIGSLGIAAFVVLSFVAWRGNGRAAALPFVGVGLFCLLVAAATTFARAGHGPAYAFNSRYTTNAVLLWVAILQILRACVREWPRPRILALGGAVLASLFVGLWSSTRAALENGRAEYQQRAASRSCLGLGTLLERTHLNDACSLYSFPRAGGARNRWESVVAAGLLEAPAPPRLLSEPDPRAGMLTDAGLSDGRGVVSGWALSGPGPEPRLLLISANDGRSFLAALPLTVGESHVGARVVALSPERVSFYVPLRENAGPAPTTPSAWVLDPKDRTLRRLGGGG